MYIHEIEWPILIFSTPSLRFQYVYLDQHTYILVWNENKKKRTEITINIKWKIDNIAAQKKLNFSILIIRSIEKINQFRGFV